MHFTEQHIQKIIDDNCGVPPKKEVLQHLIWNNESALKFEEKNGNKYSIYTPEERANYIDSLERLVKKCKNLLLKHYD
jgi:hypothetical protein